MNQILRLFLFLNLSIVLWSNLAVAKVDVDDDFNEQPVNPTDNEVIIEPEIEVHYETAVIPTEANFAEHFDDVDQAKKHWIISRAHKEEQDNVFKYDGLWDFNVPDKVIFPNDAALILRSKAKHAAIAAKLFRRFDFNTKPLYVQYEVNFQSGMDCGGAYIKLLSHSKDLDLNNFHDKTPYTIMFGPDKCGNDIKMHFIFRHKNPINGTFEEKHSKRPSNRMEDTFTDKKPHLYRLVLTPDNRFEVFVDSVLINKGSLLSDMTPPVNPPEEIEDPNDKKPTEWDERERIPDTTASKPEDWNENAAPKIPDPKASMPEGWLEDEPENIPDPTAVKPDDWDDAMDGTWEPNLIPNPNCEAAPGCGTWSAPLIENPDFKGIWKPPMIQNPNYKGKWTPRKIPNPDFFEDKEPFKMTSIGAVGLEIWSMTDNVLFDNFIITDNEAVLEEWTSQTFDKKRKAIDRDAKSLYGRIMRRINYRIGGWSVYFIYCAIPIAVYITCLIRVYREEGVISRTIKYSNAHPWLWAIYIFVIGLPLVLLFTFCCGQDKKSDIHKKTDDIAEDDEVQEEMEPTPEPSASSESKSKQKLLSSNTQRQNKVSTSKEDLETKRLDSDDESEPEEEGEPEEASSDEDKDQQGDVEKETVVRSGQPVKGSASKNIIDLNAGDGHDIGPSPPADVPKKRRARKE